MQTIDFIRQTIRQQGPLRFVDFMQIALYEPQYGYYQRLMDIGVHGDFVTAPALTHLFGYALANQCRDILHALTNPCILEFGAGAGHLCVDLLKRLEQIDALPKQYLILELSASLKSCQQQRIETEIPHLASRVQWITSWPQQPIEGVMIGNEVLDAMPIHRFLFKNNQIYEYMVDVNEQNALFSSIKISEDPRLLKHLEEIVPNLTGPYQSEVNLFLDDWLKQCHHCLARGVLFLFDYGFPRHEYYHQDRSQGTLMCHYRHHAHTDPLLYIGEQDMTAHVDFTHVAEAGFAAGFHVAGYTNQAAFLLGCDILNLLNQEQDEMKVASAQALKKLLQPNEMGELFKVIALSKQIDVFLSGFSIQDKRANLS